MWKVSYSWTSIEDIGPLESCCSKPIKGGGSLEKGTDSDMEGNNCVWVILRMQNRLNSVSVIYYYKVNELSPNLSKKEMM